MIDNTGTVDDTTWFLADARGEKAGPRLVALCREMAAQQTILALNTDKCMAVFQWGGDAKDMEPGDHCPIEDNLCSFNAAQNAIETVHSKVMKAQIAIMPLTSGGGYLQRNRARKMGKAIEGLLEQNNADDIEHEMVMDALVTDHGSGACKVIEFHDRLEIEHIPIEDVWFDEAETRHRKPRCCYHVPREGVDKYVAIEQYACDDDDGMPGLVGTPAKRREAIIRAATKPEPWRSKRSVPTASHRVDIFESWHLPSGKVEEYDEEYEDEDGETKTRKAYRHDGRHVIAVEGEDGTLVDEPWGEDYFPILLYTPRKRRRHIWGLSLMRDFIAPQREYEKLTKKIQYQNQKMALSGLASPKDAEINPREITAGTNGAGFILEYLGQQPPTPFVVDPVAAGTYAYAASIPRDMLERKGISTLAASSQLPAGLQQASGKALQVFEDFEDVRLLPYHRERERFKIKLSWIIVKTSKRIVARTGSYTSKYTGNRKNGIEEIDWKELLQDADDCILRVFPVSALSKQPAARFAQLTDLVNLQAITIEQFKRLFEIPDLEAENELDSSDTDIIDRAMDIMVTSGRYLSPEPFDDLELIKIRAGKFYNVCRQREVPENRLQLLRDYIEDTKALIDQAKAAEAATAAANAPPPPPMPMGPPGMVPPPPGSLPGMGSPMPPEMPLAA